MWRGGLVSILAVLVPTTTTLAQPVPPAAPTSPFAQPTAPFIDDNVFKPKPAPPQDAPPKVWSGAFEFGLNGSEGNSDVLKVRFGGNVKRCTDTNVFTADL